MEVLEEQTLAIDGCWVLRKESEVSHPSYYCVLIGEQWTLISPGFKWEGKSPCRGEECAPRVSDEARNMRKGGKDA